MIKLTILTLFCSIVAGSQAEELKVVIERNVPVPMRDGTILRADVYRPDRGGPYPVLVQRTLSKGGNFDRFVKAGYIIVSQDVRGVGASEGKPMGTFLQRVKEGEDGYDTVEWAAKLFNSNGKVGTFGRSALAVFQLELASLGPPSLGAMCAESSGISGASDMFPVGIESHYAWVRTGFMSILPEVLRRANRPGVHTRREASILWQQYSEKWINWLPASGLPGFDEDEALRSQWTLPDIGSDEPRVDEICKAIAVPNLDITGWYDFCNGDMGLLCLIINAGRTEVARKGSRVVVGPWLHSSPGRRRVGDFDFGPNAWLDIDGLRIRWFNYWLKGEQNGMNREPQIKIFIMGDNKWRDEQSWPIERAKERIFYITSSGHANTPNGNGKLIQQEPRQAGKDRYRYDPNNPVPTLFRPLSLHMCPNDQRPLVNREDILVYQSEPLLERREVTGRPTVELYAASSALDTDWYVRLIDVAPDGTARNVSRGIVRAKYRNGFKNPRLLTSDEVVKYTIRMFPTSNAFLVGHRIRVDITSSDFPHFDRNHNTGGDQYVDPTLVTAEQTIYHGGEQATRIILPWVPNPMPKEEAKEERLGSEPDKQLYLLHQAAGDGDVEQVRLLVSEGADINAIDEENKTPLHYAAETGKTEVTRLLVEAGADIKAKDKWLWSPLYYSAWRGHRDVAEYLISEGAEVNAKDNSGLSPLHYAARQGHRDIAELLTAKGADINAKDDNGMTPLSDALFRNQRDVAELLLAKGGQSDSKDGGLTALHNAAVQGYQEIAELLLSKGAKVDERDDNYEFTALHYAARFGNTNVAETLIANGADIRAKDKWDYEPIHWAAYHDRPEIIELLIAKGADVNAKTSLGQTSLELATPRRNTAAIAALRKHGAKE